MVSRHSLQATYWHLQTSSFLLLLPFQSLFLRANAQLSGGARQTPAVYWVTV